MNSTKVAIAKYNARGFEQGSMRNIEDIRTLFQYGCDHRVGDRWCWTINFDLDDVTSRQWMEEEPWGFEPEDSEVQVMSQFPEDPMLQNKWRLSGSHVIMAPKYCLLRLPIFRYAYAVADDMEALLARKFSDDINAVRGKGGCGERRWFDDNFTTIVKGIQVWLDDMEIDKGEDLGSADDEEELPGDSPQLYPGSAFPMKVTATIGNYELVMMLKRYRDAFQLEEMRGKSGE